MFHEVNRELGKPVEVFISESVTELAKAVAEASLKHPHPYRHRMSDDDFYGREFDCWSDVTEACDQPWESGLQIIEKMISDLGHAELPQPVSRKRKARFDECDGDELDYDRLRCGQPFWRRMQRQNTKGPSTVTIITDMRAKWTISHKDILWRGAAAIILTYLLENAGYRVELWSAQAEDCAYNDGADMFLGVQIKKTSDPVDLGGLVAAVSAWFYRIIGFHSANMQKGRNPASNAGYDRSEGVRPFQQYMTNDEHPIIVEGVWSRTAALEFIRETVANLTGSN